MSEPLRRTPLHGFHLDHNARMVPFAGWEMPVQYTSIMEEHRAVRTTAGLFDVSHMGEARIHGAEARQFLDFLLPNDLGRLEVGRALYSPMCTADGGVVDDLLVYQVGDEEYLLCLNAANTTKDLLHMEEHRRGFDCIVDDVSDDFGLLALQGPRAIALLSELTGVDFGGLKRFRFVRESIFGTNAILSRTGYTGEDGLEMYLPAGESARVANLIFEGTKEEGVQLAGLGARDSLRLEAGLPLYGHELSAEIDPLSGGIGWTVRFSEKGDFLGRKALEAKKAAGLARKVAFFTLDNRRIARAESIILDREGNARGHVLSGTMSPLLNKPIGSALVDTTALEAGDELYVQLRGHLVTVRFTKPPLHKA
ncbi:MAG: glycine cleavage system aminomethyltransferase GcvT [Verrucomicrobia bacterium]|jgi:aminomethyltransferase|nr:glycine cleavage system aminomethyltransferase GcvT [Verrucomicrobiota bacterium]